jgi:hypothetical protein
MEDIKNQGGGRREVAQTIYIHVSKCKNDFKRTKRKF